MRLRNRISETARAPKAALTDSSEPWPAVQVVPDAICWGEVHWPLAQRWKVLPPMQFQEPSGLQEPLSALPEEPEEPLEEGEAGAELVAAG